VAGEPEANSSLEMSIHFLSHFITKTIAEGEVLWFNKKRDY